MPQILQSEAFWSTVALVVTWIANSALTPYVARLDPKHPVRRVLGIALGVTQAVVSLKGKP